jgi:hypothetical protein
MRCAPNPGPYRLHEHGDASMSTGADTFVTFVVRLSRAGGGRLSAIVERARTGEKVRVHDRRTLGAVIAGMLADDEQRGHEPRLTEDGRTVSGE